MTFLNPLVLIGLAAAAIPLIIHLFNFRRPRRVEYSSLKFLKELRAATMQRVRIKRWLLLLLRTLAIGCLILAFARPTLETRSGGFLSGRARTSTAIVLDNSLSMTVRDARGAYFDQAMEIAHALVSDLEDEDEMFVMTTVDESPTDLEEIRIDARSGSAVAAIGRAATMLEERASHTHREILFVGDMQRSMLTDSITRPPRDDVRVSLFPVGGRDVSNVAVLDVRTISRVVEAGQSVRLDATLVGYGPETAEGYVASLYLEGERLSRVTVDLPPGVPVRATFNITPQQRGWLKGSVRVEDDAFPEDNVRHFSLHVPDEHSVLIVRGPEMDARFVELALQAQERVTVATRTADESLLASTPLGAYDVVVLIGPRRMSEGEIASVARFVDNGGGLMIFPGEDIDLRDYNALLDALGGGHVIGFDGTAASGIPITGIDRVDMEHPLFEGVFDARTDQVERPDIYYAMQYVAGHDREHSLIGLSDGFPFLQEIRTGRGATFVVASAPTRAWTNLPLSGLFVPLMYRSIFYLSAAESVEGERLTLGKPADIRLAGAGAPLRLVAPDGDEFIPEQRSLFGAVLVRIDGSLDLPGVYDLVYGETSVRRFALNVDTRESDLRAAPVPEAALRLEEATGWPVHSPMLNSDTVAAARRGVEVWNVFIIIAVLCLVAETLVSVQKGQTARSVADHS